MPITTLKRRVGGVVPLGVTTTVLTSEEEKKLCQYCLDMVQSSSEAKQSSSIQHGPSSFDSASVEEILALPRVKEAP